jgi:hypothetical protein
LHLTSPAMISTQTPSIDSFLHVIAIQGHCEITVSLNVHAIKSRHFFLKTLELTVLPRNAFIGKGRK